MNWNLIRMTIMRNEALQDALLRMSICVGPGESAEVADGFFERCTEAADVNGGGDHIMVPLSRMEIQQIYALAVIGSATLEDQYERSAALKN